LETENWGGEVPHAGEVTPVDGTREILQKN